VASEPYRDSIHIAAHPRVVFEYFVDPRSLVRWMGDDAVLDPRPGGRFTLVIGGRTVEGRYLHVEPPRRVVISWGRQGSRELPPEASVLEVDLTRGGRRDASQHRPLGPARLGIDPPRARVAALSEAPPGRCRGRRAGASCGATLSDRGRRLTVCPENARALGSAGTGASADRRNPTSDRDAGPPFGGRHQRREGLA